MSGPWLDTPAGGPWIHGHSAVNSEQPREYCTRLTPDQKSGLVPYHTRHQH